MPSGVYVRTEYHKKRIRDGQNNEETRKKMSISQIKRFEKTEGTFLGKKHTEESRKMMSESLKRKNYLEQRVKKLDVRRSKKKND